MPQTTLDKTFGSSPSSSPTSKRKASPKAENGNAKRSKVNVTASSNYKGALGDRASAEELNGHFDNTPYSSLLQAMDKVGNVKTDPKATAIVYWTRMHDIRMTDNRALALADAQARKENKHLIVLHVISPGDYKSHVRGARRIDFVLRNLVLLQQELAKKNIPLVVETFSPRKSIPEKVVKLCKEWNASHVFGNIEHEVDELRRDAQVVNKSAEANIQACFVHDLCVVPPGRVTTKEGKPYAVYSPFLKNWANIVDNDPSLLEASPEPKSNDKSIRSNDKYGILFDSKVPASVKGFECHDQENMKKLYPAGTAVAEQILERFLHTKSRGIGQIAESPVRDGAETDDKKSRIRLYADTRNDPSNDGTSRLSPYLAAGIISIRHLIRESKAINKNRWDTSRATGIGMWTEELAWRDFYQHVLCAFPRVCMGRSFNLKYDKVVWEHNEDHINAWKQGKTGYPIVDAAMRQLNQTGYMHNRCRMITAMFLTKDLMIDWRIGEAYYAEELVDHDFGSNNGGWQWSASTGCDPQPYFRIMNPASQSKKSDVNGDYIRKWVPELKDVKGDAIHEPHLSISRARLETMGYVWPIVDHKEARQRALRRFKEPGTS